MLPKPPRWQDGVGSLKAYEKHLESHEHSLTNRTFREFYRKGLASAQKRYRSIASNRPEDSEARAFFAALSDLFARRLEAYGPEPPPRERKKKTATAVPLTYPEFSSNMSLRLHMVENGSLKRERASAIAQYADRIYRQKAPNGEVLLSVAVSDSRPQFFEHLVNAAGIGFTRPRYSQGGFSDCGNKAGSPDWQDPDSPWYRMAADNQNAMLYHGQQRRAVESYHDNLPDISWIPESLPWDPDPRFCSVLEATEKDELTVALKHAEVIPPEDRLTQFDEMLYLRYLTVTTPRAGDIVYLARRHIAQSSISDLLREHFDAFLELLDEALRSAGPLPKGFLDNDDGWSVWENDPDPFKRATPSIRNWSAWRQHEDAACERYGDVNKARGRLFKWLPRAPSLAVPNLDCFLRPQLKAAEDAFRGARDIPAIGRGWTSEAALFDLVKESCPDAVWQWRPFFLGQQTVDVYIPSRNLAIEYQGQQHYEPVELFGGKDGLEVTKRRDERKRALLAEHRIQLLEWHYEIPITRAAVLAALGER